MSPIGNLHFDGGNVNDRLPAAHSMTRAPHNSAQGRGCNGASSASASLAFSLAIVLAASSLATLSSHAAEPKGDALFATHCAACHGVDGEGGGPVASVMNVSMPNLRTLAKRNGGVFPAEPVS